MTYDDLANLTPEELCPVSDRNIWKVAGKDSSYPFSEMRPSNYAYPMLREHYGDWHNPTQYAYGIVYYEKYTDGTIGMNLVDVSYIDANKTRQHYSLNTLQDDTKTIEETGYAVFYKNASQIIIDGKDDIGSYKKLDESKMITGELKLGETSTDMSAFLAAYDFSIWPGTQDTESTEAVTEAIVINGLDDGVHMFVPAFANEITPNWTAPAKDKKATYEIRTANQFANINADLGLASIAEGFKQTHSFTMSPATTLDKATTLDNFKGLKYTAKSDNVVHSITVGENVTLTHGIFGAVSDKSVISDVIVNGAKLNATTTAGILADTVDKDSKVTDVQIVDPQIAISVPDYKTGSTVAVGAVAGQSLGNISNVSITMSQLENADGNAENDEDDKPDYKPFVIDASATKLIKGKLNLYVGGLVGNNIGVINGDKTEVTANISYIPAAAKEGGEGSINALMSFGGLVGTNNKTVSGSMTGDISFGSIALAADDKEVQLTDNIKLGGLVGHSTSDNSNGASVSGTVTGNVHYTRPAVIADNDKATSTGKNVTDNVMLGGLVGESNSGKVTGTFDGEAKKTDETDKTIAIVKAQDIIVDETDTSNNTYVIDTSVSGTTYIGGIVGKISGGSFDNTVSASGAVKLDYSVGESYTGGIAGYVNSLAVNNANTNLDITVSTANAGLYAGGLVGNMSGNTLTGSASGKIEVTGSATNAYVGGAVGNTDGVTVTNVTSNSYINVNLDNGTRYVGGLVGYMNGGSMSASDKNTASATGEIKVSNVNATTYVGGAVGYESNATRFTNVKAAVKISNNGGSWLDKANVNANNATCPGSYANVGQFIGYVSKAQVSFTECSGSGNNAGIQFLGTIEKTRGTLGEGDYYSSTAAGKTGTVEKRDYLDDWKMYKGVASTNRGVQFYPVGNDKSYDNYAATLTNCYYTDETGTKHQQQINTVKYFYTYINNENHIHYSTGSAVTSMEENKEYIIVDKNEKWALTTKGTTIATMKYMSEFDSDKDNCATVWSYTGNNGTNKMKIKEIKNGKYLRILVNKLTWFSNGDVDAVSEDNKAQCLIQKVDSTYVRFKHPEKNYYMCMSDATNGKISDEPTKSTGDNTKFKIYPVIAKDFTRGTMSSTSYYHEEIK